MILDRTYKIANAHAPRQLFSMFDRQYENHASRTLYFCMKVKG